MRHRPAGLALLATVAGCAFGTPARAEAPWGPPQPLLSAAAAGAGAPLRGLLATPRGQTAIAGTHVLDGPSPAAQVATLPSDDGVLAATGTDDAQLIVSGGGLQVDPQPTFSMLLRPPLGAFGQIAPAGFAPYESRALVALPGGGFALVTDSTGGVALLRVGGAAAAPAPVPVFPYLSGERTDSVAAAVEPDGTLAVVQAVEQGDDGHVVIRLAEVGADDSVRRQDVAVLEHRNATGPGPSATVAALRGGAIAVLWDDPTPPTSAYEHFHGWIHAATRPAGAPAFGPIQQLATTIELHGRDRLLAHPDGSVTALFLADTGGYGTTRVFTADAPAGTLRFGRARQLPGQLARRAAGSLTVAQDHRDDAIAAWTASDPYGDTRILTAARPAGGGFGPARVATPLGMVANAPRLALRADAHVLLGWTAVVKRGRAPDLPYLAQAAVPLDLDVWRHAPRRPALGVRARLAAPVARAFATHRLTVRVRCSARCSVRAVWPQGDGGEAAATLGARHARTLVLRLDKEAVFELRKPLVGIIVSASDAHGTVVRRRISVRRR